LNVQGYDGTKRPCLKTKVGRGQRGTREEFVNSQKGQEVTANLRKRTESETPFERRNETRKTSSVDNRTRDKGL